VAGGIPETGTERQEMTWGVKYDRAVLVTLRGVIPIPIALVFPWREVAPAARDNREYLPRLEWPRSIANRGAVRMGKPPLLLVPGLGFADNGNVGVGILPESEA